MEAEPRVALSMRLDPQTEVILDALAAHLGLTRSGVVRLALRRLARAEGLPVPTPAPAGKAGP